MSVALDPCDNIGNLLVCAASELSGNSQVCRNELYAWFGKWIGWPDIKHATLTVREQDRILRATARDKYTAVLRSSGVSVTYHDISNTVISGLVDYRQKNISTVTVSWYGVSRTRSVTPQHRNDARTAFLVLIKWCCANGCLYSNAFPAPTRSVLDPAILTFAPPLSLHSILPPNPIPPNKSSQKKKAKVTERIDDISTETADAVHALLQLAQPKSLAQGPNALPTSSEKQDSITSIIAPPSPNDMVAIENAATAPVSPTSQMSAPMCIDHGEFAASAMAAAKSMALSASNAAIASVSASKKADLAEQERNAAADIAKDSVATLERLKTLAHEASTAAALAVSASSAADAAVLIATEHVTETEKALELAVSQSTLARSEADKASGVAILTATASTATIAVAKAVMGESYKPFTVPTVSLDTGEGVTLHGALLVDPMAITATIAVGKGLDGESHEASMGSVVVSDKRARVASVAAKNPIIRDLPAVHRHERSYVAGETLDYDVEKNNLQHRIMSDGELDIMTMRSRQQMLSLQNVLDTAYKESILRIFVNSMPMNNSLMGWSKIIVDNTLEFHTRVSAMITCDNAGIWRRFSGQNKKPLQNPTWVVYELFRRLGIKPRFRGLDATHVLKNDMFYHTEWTFRNDDSYTKAFQHCTVGFHTKRKRGSQRITPAE